MNSSETMMPSPAAPMLDVPRWARTAAQAVPLVTLPSALWRVALVAGVPVMADVQLLWWEPAYILGLSLVSELLALLTLGLVQPWGEVVPRWLPLLGGRRVPPLAAIVPAALGAVTLTLIWGFAFWNVLTGSFLDSFDGVQQGLVIVCYTPALAWGPLLAAVTIAYHRRRRPVRS